MMTLFNTFKPIKFDKVILWAIVLCMSSILYASNVFAEATPKPAEPKKVAILSGKEEYYEKSKAKADELKIKSAKKKAVAQKAKNEKNAVIEEMDKYKRNGGCEGYEHKYVKDLNPDTKAEIIKNCGKDLANKFFAAYEKDQNAALDFEVTNKAYKIANKETADYTVDGDKNNKIMDAYEREKSKLDRLRGEGVAAANKMEDECDDMNTRYMRVRVKDIERLKEEMYEECPKTTVDAFISKLKEIEQAQNNFDNIAKAAPKGETCGKNVCLYNQVCKTSIYQSAGAAMASTVIYTCEDGAYNRESETVKEKTEKEKEFDKKTKLSRIENVSCQIEEMRKAYQSRCYSCMIIKTLITTFMDAASNVQDITTDAGTKILQLGLMIWLAFFALKNVTSLTNVEPGSMINTLFTMLFKCLVAYVFITSGITAFMMYIIEPIMDAGASYGIALMQGSPAKLELTPSSGNIYGGTKIVSASLINNIMGFTESLDKTVSTNLVIGHALTCHATHAGMWRWEALTFEFGVPNFWIWLCGAAIWFCGFMLTLSVGYYMLDMSFKLGFAIIVFPVVAALWPFNLTQDKLKKCVSIIIKAAATFAMLALTASYSLSLISSSLRNLDEFYKKVEMGDSEWISNTFDITGSYFIIIIFAYLYSMKLIASSVPDYVNKIFPDDVFKSDPMHSKLTQVTDMAKNAATGAASFAGGVVGHQAGKLADKGLQKTVKGVRNLASKFKNDGDGKDEGGGGGAGGGMKSAGTATKNTGKAMEQTGKAAEQTGKAMEKGGQAASKSGDGMMKGGKALSATGLGAIVGVPMMIAGGATKAAGVTAEYAGKATAATGKAMQKTGKVLKKTGKTMEKAGEKMQKVGKGLKDKGGKMGKKKEDQPENQDKQE